MKFVPSFTRLAHPLLRTLDILQGHFCLVSNKEESFCITQIPKLFKHFDFIFSIFRQQKK